MFTLSPRLAALSVLVAVSTLVLSSCSGTVAAKAGTPEFYWSAARSAYGAGDYPGAIEQLAHLTDGSNEYRGRAIPWSLVLTTGLAAGYMETADSYARGARSSPERSALYRRMASEYRSLASPLVQQSARLAEQFDELPPGSVTLSFGRPRGSLAQSPLLYKIAAGFAITPDEAESVVTQTLDRNVLVSACAVVGAPNDSAKASEILGHASTITARPAFAAAMAGLLEKSAVLFDRAQLDLPARRADVDRRVKALRVAADQVGPAMVVQVQANAR